MSKRKFKGKGRNSDSKRRSEAGADGSSGPAVIHESRENDRTSSRKSGAGRQVLIFGMNSVMEIARSNPSVILEIHICRKDSDYVISDLNSCLEKKPHIRNYDLPKKEDFHAILKNHGVSTEGENHQGIFCIRKPYEIFNENDFFEAIDQGELKDNKDFKVLALDEVQDPHHFGAIIRIAAAFGVPWIVIQSARSAPLSQISVKVACGGAEHVKIAEVTNLARFMEEVKSRDFWNVGTSERGETHWKKVREPGRYLVVIGNEGEGIRPLIQKQCDFWLKLPVSEEFPSLSASTAASATLALLTS